MLVKECADTQGKFVIPLEKTLVDFSFSMSVMKSTRNIFAIIDNRMCPMTCELCKRLCGCTDHLHALAESSVHLCG